MIINNINEQNDNIQDNLVYKFYNINNELLYVGITNNMKIRLKQHKQDKEWFDEIKRIYITEKMTRNEAHIYEIFYIANENPLYNIDYINGGKVGFVISELLFKDYKKERRKRINVDIVLRMYNEGKSIEEIATELKYSTEYIAKNLRSKLIELREVKPNRRNGKNERFEMFVNCLTYLSNKKYFTIEDIVYKFMNDYECTEETAKTYYKDEFAVLLIEEVNKIGLKRIRANKVIKEQFGMDGEGYPFIICKDGE